MPIPTRSLSLREANVGQRKESNIGRPTTTRLGSIKTSVSNATNSSSGPVSKTQWKSSPTDAIPSTADASPVNKEDDSASRKSLLPQRSSSQRVNGRVGDGVLLQRQESRLRRPGLAPPFKEQPQESSATVRRQNAAQTGVSKASTTVKLGEKAAPRLPRPPSPTKSQTSSPKAVSALRTENIPSRSGAPSSPQRSAMPPPARPTRSASLRQPATVSSAIPPAVRGHARHRSQIVTTTSSRNEPSPRSDVASSASLARSRPQFSTYQQHYSPKKNAKPPTPTTAASSASTELDSFMMPSSRSDVAALQTELMQLHLFYSSYNQQNIDWKRDSEKKLSKMYNSTSESYRSVLAQEQATQTELNCLALDHWSETIANNASRQDFAEQIQTLSHVVQEVNDMTEAREGRYPKVIHVFEDWMENAARVKQVREQAFVSTFNEDLDFLDPLDRSWKEEVDMLSARLDLCLRKLQNLDILGEAEHDQMRNSALLRIASGHQELLASMLEELSVMRSIEADIVRSEKSSITNMVDNLQPVDGRHETRVGIWT
ncbi:predicted protein [Paecilomyces variotii No. 5]|uniref:Uncharacterized protein n=1 Tax=Byssochlamys spectabilis (strain No. 5 / NBRC 109023) TaxID=1356009 RepID=V5FVF3_BYSSN|nr:predicted protein [Paecilomyces variotii No. 5]